MAERTITLTGREVSRQLADLALGTFGAVHPTVEQRDALADALIAYAVEWINAEFELGMGDTGLPSTKRSATSHAQQVRLLANVIGDHTVESWDHLTPAELAAARREERESAQPLARAILAALGEHTS